MGCGCTWKMALVHIFRGNIRSWSSRRSGCLSPSARTPRDAGRFTAMCSSTWRRGCSGSSSCWNDEQNMVFSARFYASLFAAAFAFLLADGIAVTVIAAQPSIESPMTPITSTVTDMIPNRKAPVGAPASKASVPAGPSAMREGPRSKLSSSGDWPAPVNDQEHRLFTLIDVLEYRPKTGGSQGNDDYRWDIEGWYGGDYNRLWFKSEGQQDTAFKADYDVDFQLLYGRFIQKYYDFQIGPRVETQSFRGRNVTRGLGVIGIEGLVPYDYEFESSLFIDQNGAVST